MRNFAARLVAHEAALQSVDSGVSTAFAVSAKMRAHLTTLMGNGGHRALLMRALALASAEVSWLCLIEVAIDGTLQGTAPLDESVAPDDALMGGVVLVAQLLGLLVAFIGERLTLHLVREVWPKFPARDLNFKI
jgi:hypothetical protein